MRSIINCSQFLQTENFMAKITLGGKPANTIGELPTVGKTVTFSKLLKNDMTEVSSESYAGKTKVLSIFPSVDTGVCAASIRRFNKEAAQLKNTVVLNISMDLPFANGRFCGSEGITNCETLSAFRSDFGKEMGLVISDTAFTGLLARAVLVLSPDNKVIHSELVSEIGTEPNYDAALKNLKQ